MFSGTSAWAMPWMAVVLPRIEEIAARHSSRTIFTRFGPAQRPGDGLGAWRRYYLKWSNMTLEAIGPEQVGIVGSLARLCPPARVADKRVYSPWLSGDFTRQLGNADTVIVTGGETDICVAATVHGAIDRGYRVILVEDAICSSADDTHDAAMTIYRNRFSQQVELIGTEALLSLW